MSSGSPQDFHDFLTQHGAYEPRESRDRVLGELRVLAQNTLVQLAPDRQSKTAQLLLCPYGSFALGLCCAGSDIDILCVAPQFVKLKSFFESFASILRRTGQATQIQTLPDAQVPLIVFRFRNIDIDMTFVHLKLPTIPPNLDCLSDSLFSLLLPPQDEKGQTSLGGVRTTNYLIRRMRPHMEVFLDLVRFLRLWAKSRLIYGHSFGYLAGIDCQLLAAITVLQNQGQRAPDALVLKFFELCVVHPWGNTPLALEHPTIPKDKWSKQPMVILAPTSPPGRAPINTMKRCTPETAELIKREFAIGLQKARGKRPWKEFMEPPDVFEGCTRAIRMRIWTPKKKGLDAFELWKKTTESKVLELVKGIQPEGQANWRVIPLARIFETPGQIGPCTQSACIFYGLTHQGERPPVNLKCLRTRVQRSRTGGEELKIKTFRRIIGTEPYKSQLQLRM
jgi:poly(A) polymerase Pap1